MPTEQQPVFVTKREVDKWKAINDEDSARYNWPPSFKDARIIRTLQHFAMLLGEECVCGYGPHERRLHACQPCQRKAALLRVWNGEAEQQ